MELTGLEVVKFIQIQFFRRNLSPRTIITTNTELPIY